MESVSDADGSDVFVGREREMAQLLGGLEAAWSGRGHLFLIAGEPGIGKSRVIDEIARRAEERGARVLWGRSWEEGGAPPYWPWIESIRAYLDERDPEDVRKEMGAGAPDISRMMPELRETVPGLPDPPTADPETARFRLFDATASFLQRASVDRPMILILDDIHAADAPSILLLRFVARRIRGIRALLLAAYRDTDVARHHPLAAALPELIREPASTRITLAGLSEEDVGRFIGAVTGTEPLPGLASSVHRETEGNPLFVVELVRMLAGEGRLGGDRGAWVSAIPRGVRELIDLRLARLSEPSVDTLRMAAVVGREFGVEIMDQLGERNRHEVLAALGEAREAGVVAEVPGPPGRLRFSHALVREALYEDLGPGRRAELHRRVGEALERLYGTDPGPLLAELAHHLFEGAPEGDVGKAVEYCARAAERATSVLAYEEAVRLYGMALRAQDLGGSPEESRRCDLLLALGDAQARAGEEASARETFVRAAQAARRLRSPGRLGRAALGYGGRFVWERAASDRGLVPLLQDALRETGEEHGELRARLLARLAGASRDDPDPGRRTALSREAVEIARGLGDAATLAYVLDGRFAAIWSPDTTEERLAIADEMIANSRRAEDLERAFQGHHYRMIGLLEVGDVAGARAELAAKQEIAEELHQPAHRWYLASSRAMVALLLGEPHAERTIEEALMIGQPVQPWNARFAHLLQLFVLRRDQGRAAELEGSLRRSVEVYEVYPLLKAVLAAVLIEAGRPGEARGPFEELVAEDGVALPRDNEWLFGMTVLAEVAFALGDELRAALLYDLLTPFAHRNVVAPVEVSTGSVARYLGLLARTMRRWQDAERHFADAVAANRRMGARPWEVRTLIDHAGSLAARREAGDAERALELAGPALDLARSLGMAAVADRAVGLFRDLGEEPPGVDRLVRTFMFTDIVGSTALVEAVGDEAWEELRRWHDRTLRGLFADHGGEEIDHAGDGFFVSFPGPDPAMRCAVAIQRRLDEHRRTQGFSPRVRIGLHTGEAVRTVDGYAGRAVHVAARVAGLAGADEIMVTVESLGGGEPPVSVGERRTAPLKGIGEPVVVLPLEWQRGR